MRTIRIIEHISLDGVIQGPGGPGEDTSGGFGHGGWIVPFADPVVGEAINAAHGARFDLLLGRRTYDIWAAYWPRVQSGAITAGFNAATKHVVTHRAESLAWGPAEGIGGDAAEVAERIGRIKSADGADLIVWGSSTLTTLLLERGLADEVVLLTYPVLLGAGKRLFAETGAARELALVGTKAGASGVVVNRYRPVGESRVSVDFANS